MQGWGGSCMGGVGHSWVGLGKVWKISLNNLICHQLGIISLCAIQLK